MPVVGDRLGPPVFLSGPEPSVHLDAQRIDDLILSHGVAMVHSRASRCPVGVVDPNDGRRPHVDHEGCSNGYLYSRAGVVQAVFQGNSKDKRKDPQWWSTSAAAQVTVPRSYQDAPGPVLLSFADRLEMADEAVIVTHWETIRASGLASDRASFPVQAVQDLVDFRGVRYAQDVDFELRAGRIAWTRRRPTSDPSSRLPAVFTVRYTYRPTWLVQRLVHEVRPGQAPTADGGVGTILLPQSAMVVREVFHEGSQERDPEARGGDPARQARAPEDGGVGPR